MTPPFAAFNRSRPHSVWSEFGRRQFYCLLRDCRRRRPKKSKLLDPSKYTTRFIAFKLAYVGTNYNGFEDQSSGSLSTLKEELWKALAGGISTAEGSKSDRKDAILTEEPLPEEPQKEDNNTLFPVEQEIQCYRVLNSVLSPDIKAYALSEPAA
ncbi:hypothetical protein M406DRAFT_335299 [Cryphonectria parasitica EP155]|uniref:Uncharacterized protein n=1 Tax=Cryphonectria parasitica (strain ATCC 38755 / EP155) TaxID=660469 RepID=A0A9P5CJN4_CRYP1|nr:uncharacterized protein M406DRAFT_335299 [Cryphonectria parasitica EP155]KAF3760101.1 hypothetical protein M406DRAFT_335299 [Cryphonectria parasitica EP155]